jgi:hypothetical protein
LKSDPEAAGSRLLQVFLILFQWQAAFPPLELALSARTTSRGASSIPRLGPRRLVDESAVRLDWCGTAAIHYHGKFATSHSIQGSCHVTGLNRIVSGLAICSLLAVIAGCPPATPPKPKTYPASGTVLYNGNPVEGATVSFWGEKSSRPATGITDKDGKFKLSTYGANDGAVEGPQQISVTKGKAAAATAGPDLTMLNDPSKMASMGQAQKDAAPSTEKPEIPLKYADQAKSPLKETIKTEGENVFVLQLTD